MLSYVFILRMGSDLPVSKSEYVINILNALKLDTDSETKIIYETIQSLDEALAAIIFAVQGIKENIPTDIISKIPLLNFHDKWGVQGKVLAIDRNEYKDNSGKWQRLTMQGNTAYKQGDYQHAAMYYEEALVEAKAYFDENDPKYSTTINNLGAVYNSLDSYEKAAEYCKEAVKITGKIYGEDHIEYAYCLHNLAVLYERIGQYEHSIQLFHSAIGILEKKEQQQTPQFFTFLLNIADYYKTKQDYKQARLTLFRALKIGKHLFGNNSQDYARCLNKLGELYHTWDKFQLAEAIFKKSIKIFEIQLGNEHFLYALGVHNLGVLKYSKGEYNEAKKFIEKALNIRLKTLGEMHLSCAVSYNTLGLIFEELGKFSEAEKAHNTALRIKRSLYGDFHLSCATSLNSLASLYHSTGEYKTEKSYLLDALQIRKQILGTMHPEYAISLNNLATWYRNMGEYTKAEEYFKQALVVEKNFYGEEHSAYLTTLNNLALLYLIKGEYNQVELNLLKVLKLRQKVKGLNHPEIAISFESLAGFYSEIGEDDKAIEYHMKALSLREELLGGNHPDVARSMSNLAVQLFNRGEHERAATIFERCLGILEKALGAQNSLYASVVTNLANSYVNFSITDTNINIERVSRLLDQALSIYKTTLGEQHLDYATCLDSKAMLLVRQKKFNQAADFAYQSIKIKEHIFGKNHLRIVESLHILAKIDILLQNMSTAFEKYLKIMKIESKWLSRIASLGNEKRIQSYTNSLNFEYYALLTLFHQNSKIQTKHMNDVYHIVLKRKMISLEISAIQRENLLVTHNPEFQEDFMQLREYRLNYAKMISDGPQKQTPEEYQAKINSIEQAIENLETKLAAHIPQIEVERKLTNVNPKAISALLPEETHLLDFIFYKPIKFAAAGFSFQSPHYLVFIVNNKQPNTIKMIDLGEAQIIDSLIKKHRDYIIKGEQGNDRNAKNIHTPEASFDASSGQKLFDILFKPIIECLPTSTKLIISPDHDISLLPFEVLPINNDRFVVEEEKYDIHYIDSARDLIRFENIIDFQSPPLFLADPDFDLIIDDDDIALTQIAHKQHYEHLQYMFNRSADLNEFHFESLAGTKLEVCGILKLFEAKFESWFGKDVLEGRLKKIHGPQILHLATHGFYMPEKKNQSTYQLLGQIKCYNSSTETGEKPFRNPLLRSGLALAGVNTILQGKKAPDEAEDGILTAYDVTGMDLVGTHLVVLSACETGLGDILAGEGIYGLRRAFILAGARAMIISLWQVPDEETKELMINYYNNLSDGQDKAAALRNSQRAMIKKLRDRGHYPDPWLWGAFVFAGDVNNSFRLQ